MGTLITMKTMATTEMTTAVTNQLFGIKSEMRIVDAFDLLDDGMATLEGRRQQPSQFAHLFNYLCNAFCGLYQVVYLKVFVWGVYLVRNAAPTHTNG